MKLILTKADCKRNVATRVNSPKELKKKRNFTSLPFDVPSGFHSEGLIDQLLFGSISFTHRMTLYSRKDNKVFILENCSLYKTHELIRANMAK